MIKNLLKKLFNNKNEKIVVINGIKYGMLVAINESEVFLYFNGYDFEKNVYLCSDYKSKIYRLKLNEINSDYIKLIAEKKEIDDFELEKEKIKENLYELFSNYSIELENINLTFSDYEKKSRLAKKRDIKREF